MGKLIITILTEKLLIVSVLILSSTSLLAQDNCLCRIDSVAVLTDTAKCLEYDGQFTDDSTSFVATTLYLDNVGNKFLEWAVSDESPYLEWYRIDLHRKDSVVHSMYFDVTDLERKDRAVLYYQTRELKDLSEYWKFELYGITRKDVELKLETLRE